MRPDGGDRRRVVVTGMGVISSLGDSPAALHDALVRGRSGLAPVRLGEISRDGRSSGEPRAGAIPDFSAADYLGKKNLRSLDRTARLVIAAAQLACEDSGWTAELRRETCLGLVLGTMFGSVHTISRFDRWALEAGPQYARPLDFANSVINAAAGQTAIWHDLRGLNSTIAGGTTAGLQALAYATDRIRTGRASVLLAGGAEELCFESFYAFHRAGLLAARRNGHESPGESPIPFHPKRNGFALGEGAALLVLEDAVSARERGALVLAEIQGHGSSYDCSRGGEDEAATEAVRRSMDIALEDAGMTAADVDALSASANGSVVLDRCEAWGIGAALGAVARDLPVTAIKSMLGETLGASGALQTVALVESLRSGVVPGIRGLEAPAAGLRLSGARAESRRSKPGGRGLVNAVGLDGQVCSLVVGHGDTRTELEPHGTAGSSDS